MSPILLLFIWGGDGLSVWEGGRVDGACLVKYVR
jgi:hypothetical protein